MSNDTMESLSRDELMSAMFANLVFQNTNMALMFLGQVPHPETGEKRVDMDAAQMFIDQLEMLELKTKGNLKPEEQKLLQQSLTHLRLTFVDVVQSPAAPAKPPESSPNPNSAETPPHAEPAQSAAAPEDDSRKRFSKKY